jgi:ketosteroid isomerase-like protein
LKKAMDESLKAYAAGNKRFFDFLREDVRVYAVNSAEPLIGRKKFESSFAPTLAGSKRKVKVVSSDLQESERQAVLSQTLEIASEGVTVYVRQTVIWERGAGGRWQMSHIHNSFVGQPLASGRVPTSIRGIQVLNERIATVAAAVGVAQ